VSIPDYSTQAESHVIVARFRATFYTAIFLFFPGRRHLANWIQKDGAKQRETPIRTISSSS